MTGVQTCALPISGAVFTHVLLADEINRTTPRVQSALLEAMNECQVTVDGKTHRLEPPFFVIATENHLDATGTFPLPDSELDRFAVSFSMSRPDVETQGEILKLHLQGDPEAGVDKALGREALLALQEQVRDVRVAEELIGYVAALVDATHAASELREGVSARASLALMRTSQAYAFLAGRDAVYPDDIKHMLPHVFGHRLRPRGRSNRQGGHRVQEVLEGILAAVPVP